MCILLQKIVVKVKWNYISNLKHFLSAIEI